MKKVLMMDTQILINLVLVLVAASWAVMKKSGSRFRIGNMVFSLHFC